MQTDSHSATVVPKGHKRDECHLVCHRAVRPDSHSATVVPEGHKRDECHLVCHRTVRHECRLTVTRPLLCCSLYMHISSVSDQLIGR